MNAKIALVVPYFGKLPRWFPYFLRSVLSCPLLDVLFFSDALIECPVPSNFHIFPSSLAGIADLATRQLGTPITLHYAYKLCDMKPAYGKIFSEYLSDYEFWAFGDVDVIFGDLSSFLLPLLSNQDLLSFRRGWISGSFCIMRNTEQINSLFTASADWQKVFSSPMCEQFDEMGAQHFLQILSGADLMTLPCRIDSFTHVVRRASAAGEIRCMFEDLACEHLDWGETVRFQDGVLHREGDRKPVMYVHFAAMRRRFFAVSNKFLSGDDFVIRNTGLYAKAPGLWCMCTRETFRVIKGAAAVASRLLRRQLALAR